MSTGLVNSLTPDLAGRVVRGVSLFTSEVGTSPNVGLEVRGGFAGLLAF